MLSSHSMSSSASLSLDLVPDGTVCPLPCCPCILLSLRLYILANQRRYPCLERSPRRAPTLSTRALRIVARAQATRRAARPARPHAHP